jgi:hypothetical protein
LLAFNFALSLFHLNLRQKPGFFVFFCLFLDSRFLSDLFSCSKSLLVVFFNPVILLNAL